MGRSQREASVCLCGHTPTECGWKLAIRDASRVAMSLSIPTVTGDGKVKPWVSRHSSCLATASTRRRMIPIPSRIEGRTRINTLSWRRFKDHGTHLRHPQNFGSCVQKSLNCRRCSCCRGIELAVGSTTKPCLQPFHVKDFFHGDSDPLEG